ncbi:hypothetical protein LCGC14_0447010 [marine sediment metagenome]|uniref:Uncharacterized protein n=1 Tax=marine sediment metagenome TaxID=412755 RepID=A0A0F9SIY5_9ZZZZ
MSLREELLSEPVNIVRDKERLVDVTIRSLPDGDSLVGSWEAPDVHGQMLRYNRTVDEVLAADLIRRFDTLTVTALIDAVAEDTKQK